MTTAAGGAETEVLGFEELDCYLAYACWQLRQHVFVVEQDCAYPDLDGRDSDDDTRHVLLRIDGVLAGYARILEEAPEQNALRIGRVVLAPRARGRGLGDVLMRAAVADCQARYPGREVVLAAQAALEAWYSSLGFEVCGEEFDEDGIRHVPMRRILTVR